MKLSLPTLEHTLRLGRVFARTLPSSEPYPPVLLSGELGSGKTTFVRGLVKALPGGGLAEVASPSFNLVNRYPTRPPVTHMDLYRLDGLRPDEELLECLEEPGLVLVEWAEHLPADAIPGDCVLIGLSRETEGRTARIQPKGELFQEYMRALGEELRNFS